MTRDQPRIIRSRHPTPIPSEPQTDKRINESKTKKRDTRDLSISERVSRGDGLVLQISGGGRPVHQG